MKPRFNPDACDGRISEWVPTEEIKTHGSSKPSIEQGASRSRIEVGNNIYSQLRAVQAG